MVKADYKHFFTVNGDGTMKLENKNVLDLELKSLGSKRAYFIIRTKEKVQVSRLFSFYFGVIIAKYCMNSNIFAGYSRNAIHGILFSDLRGVSISIGDRLKRISEDDFSEYSDLEKRKYIDEVIPHLATEYDIHVKDKEENYEYS